MEENIIFDKINLESPQEGINVIEDPNKVITKDRIKIKFTHPFTVKFGCVETPVQVIAKCEHPFGFTKKNLILTISDTFCEINKRGQLDESEKYYLVGIKKDGEIYEALIEKLN